MNNIAINMDIAKNCIPYIQSTPSLVITESIKKRMNDIIAVTPIAISENKYRLKIFVDFLIGNTPYNLLKLLLSVIAKTIFSIKTMKVNVTIILIPGSTTTPRIIGIKIKEKINFLKGFMA
jgi:hypothetical protein